MRPICFSCQLYFIYISGCTLAIQRLPLVELPVITSLLKQFFQHLPESLVDYSATIALLQAVGEFILLSKYISLGDKIMNLLWIIYFSHFTQIEAKF